VQIKTILFHGKLSVDTAEVPMEEKYGIPTMKSLEG